MLGIRTEPDPRAEQDHHRGEQRNTLADAANHLSEGIGERKADAQQQSKGQEVRQSGGVLERVRTVRVEEATTVCAELLDRLHEADRADGDGLGHVVQDVVDVNRAAQSLRGSLADEDESENKGDGQLDVEHAARDVDPEVADGLGVPPREAADKGDSYGNAHGHAHELLHREGGHLGEVRHRRFAVVVLPVCVRHE